MTPNRDKTVFILSSLQRNSIPVSSVYYNKGVYLIETNSEDFFLEGCVLAPSFPEDMKVIQVYPVFAISNFGEVEKLYQELRLLYFPTLPEKVSLKVVPGVDWLGQTVKKEDPEIHLSDKVLEDMLVCRRVLTHEMVHLFLYLLCGNDVANHGETFQEIAKKINISEGEGYVSEFGDNIL
jgi:hypothetical protein